MSPNETEQVQARIKAMKSGEDEIPTPQKICPIMSFRSNLVEIFCYQEVCQFWDENQKQCSMELGTWK
jgi:hypothetical protein